MLALILISSGGAPYRADVGSVALHVSDLRLSDWMSGSAGWPESAIGDPGERLHDVERLFCTALSCPCRASFNWFKRDTTMF